MFLCYALCCLGFDLLIIDVPISCSEPADAHPDLLEPVVARPDLPTCPPVCRLDQCDVDPTPDHVARLRCVANCLLPPVRAY
jgi:hypothetical protein